MSADGTQPLVVRVRVTVCLRWQLAKNFPEDLMSEIEHLAYETWDGLNRHGIMLKTRLNVGARWLVLATELLARKERYHPRSHDDPSGYITCETRGGPHVVFNAGC